MMIVMKEGASRQEVQAVIARVEGVGAKAHVSEGELVTVIGAIGDREHVANLQLEGYPGVDHVTPITKPYKLASTQFRKGARTVIGTFKERQRSHRGSIKGPRIQSPSSLPAGLSRTPRKRCCSTSRGLSARPSS